MKRTGELFIKSMKSCGNLLVKGYCSLVAYLYTNASKHESRKTKEMPLQHTKSD